MTLEQMLDTYPAPVQERILNDVKAIIERAKADLPFLIAEEFGNAGLRNANLKALKGLIEEAARLAAVDVVGQLGLYYTRQLTQASDNMMKGTLAGIAIAKGVPELGQALADSMVPPDKVDP